MVSDIENVRRYFTLNQRRYYQEHTYKEERFEDERYYEKTMYKMRKKAQMKSGTSKFMYEFGMKLKVKIEKVRKCYQVTTIEK